MRRQGSGGEGGGERNQHAARMREAVQNFSLFFPCAHGFLTRLSPGGAGAGMNRRERGEGVVVEVERRERGERGQRGRQRLRRLTQPVGGHGEVLQALARRERPANKERRGEDA